VVAEHEALFEVIERFSVTERHRLDRPSLLDLLRATYRGARTSAARRVEALDTLEVTVASELFLFKARTAPLT
jgi:hypothetical protein